MTMNERPQFGRSAEETERFLAELRRVLKERERRAEKDPEWGKAEARKLLKAIGLLDDDEESGQSNAPNGWRDDTWMLKDNGIHWDKDCT